MAFHATPKNGGLLFFIRASILPILIATIFLMQMVLTEADHNWRVVVRRVNPSPPPAPVRGWRAHAELPPRCESCIPVYVNPISPPPPAAP